MHNKQRYKQSQMQKKLSFYIKDKRMISPNIKISTTGLFFKKTAKTQYKNRQREKQQWKQSSQKEL